jgi:lipopolysaccharide transport system ATP-binding protein
LLVDEVLAVGDAEFQKKCLGKMDEVAKGGRTVVFVSHNMGAVKQLCEKIIFLNQGKIHYFSNNLDIPINAYLNFGLTQGEEIISKFINRKGNGKLLFKGITFQNDKNLNIEYISIGETLKIVLQYKIQSSLVIRKLSVRIEVANKAGTILFVCNSNHSNCEYLNLSGNGKVICSIPQLPLNKGMYFLSISGRQYGEVLDSVDLVAPLIVESNDFFGTGRLPSSEIPILLKNNWN